MILIFTKSRFESTTEEVIDWLIALDQEYQRINGNDFLDIHQDFNVIKSIWYWKWSIEHTPKIAMDSYKNTQILTKSVLYEYKAQSDFLHYKLKNTYWLSHPKTASINKLIVLDQAI